MMSVMSLLIEGFGPYVQNQVKGVPKKKKIPGVVFFFSSPKSSGICRRPAVTGPNNTATDLNVKGQRSQSLAYHI